MLNSNSRQEISRYDLKRDLQGIQSFDISSFCDSKNQSTGFKAFINHHNFNLNSNNQIIFPIVNAPTLQQSDYHINKLKDKNIQKNKQQNNKFNNNNQQSQQFDQNQQDQNLTARNQSMLKNNFYQQKIQQLNKELEKTIQKYEKQMKQKDKLEQKIQNMQIQNKKIIQQLKNKNKQQKDQIKLLKERQIKIFKQKQQLQKQLAKNQISYKTHNTIGSIGRESRAASIYSNTDSIGRSTVSTTSFIQDPSNFCPELLSPQQTVLLLSKLLKKVSKSTKMIKQLINDQNVKTILYKIQKKQI